MLESLFEELNKRGEAAHMAHVYYGDPREEFSIRLIETLTENGADIIEFGIPFSDPIADGPTFQAACERALKRGMTPRKCLEGLKRLRDRGLKAPVVLTTYFNIPFHMGLKNFLELTGAAGVQAVLIPDLPLEEAEPLLKLFDGAKLKLIFQVSPTTSEERLRRILEKASGFVYLIGVEGVTGAKAKKPKATVRLIKAVKAKTTVPVMVGFGIFKPEHAEIMVAAEADGVVVGSTYARIYSQNLKAPFKKLLEIAKLARSIKAACMKSYIKPS